MESENTRINSKASVICDNVERNLISVHLKGLQSLIEYSTVRSNRSLVNYLTEKTVITCRIKYLSIRTVQVTILTRYGK